MANATTGGAAGAATGIGLGQSDLDALVNGLNELALALGQASTAAQKISLQVDSLRKRLPPGPGTGNTGHP